MQTLTTERLNPSSIGLDMLEADEILRRLLAGQIDAVRAVEASLSQISEGAELMAAALRGGGRLAYAGAGSSALMANADGMELAGTYGVDPQDVLLHMAGGIPTQADMPGDTEDSEAEGAAAGAGTTARDVVIAVTASGRTPYALAFARAARANGSKIIAIANNRGAAIFALADVAICLPTPPEVIAGSTRMGAGSAQKVALNLMSTLMGIKLGQVHDGMMIGVVADNDKLRARAAGMVATIAGVDEKTAMTCLQAAGGAVKPAVLISCGASLGEAHAILTETQGNLRAALARLRTAGIASRA
jgi:N-acetylmuramic acid 6-phosphate etherase